MVYVFPLLAVTGVAAGVVNVAMATLLAVSTPDALRGRVFAAAGALFTSAEIGSMALGGVLLSSLAPRTIFQLAGVIATFSVLLVGSLELRTAARRHARATNAVRTPLDASEFTLDDS